MEKWEYLIMRVSSTAMKMEPVILFGPERKVDVKMLRAALPTLEPAKDVGGLTGFKASDLGPMSLRVAVMDFLGSQGWELVTGDGGLFTFKRPTG